MKDNNIDFRDVTLSSLDISDTLCYNKRKSEKGWDRSMISIVLIVAIIALSVMYSNEKKKNSVVNHQAIAQNGKLQLSSELIGREAENQRRAAESALRTRAEALVARYDQSALVADLVNTIRDCIQYGIIWDIELKDAEVAITTMTDALENRICLMTERYNYTAMGYQDPPKECEHRLALALALQKKLGTEYGIEYQFQYNPVSDNFVMSDLMVSYRKKEQNGETLRSPI